MSWGRSSSPRPSMRWRAREVPGPRDPGSRFNLGVKFGVVEAQIALAMAGVDRERILAVLLESIVRIEQEPPR